MNPRHSRNDLTNEEISKRIRLVKRDHGFPKRWRDIELDYLYALKRHQDKS